MAQPVRQHIAALLLSARRYRRYVALLALGALVVGLCVGSGLVQMAAAMSHTEKVLDCHYAGNGAHTHNADCYDANGNLVCPLEERELHTHDESCYDEQGNLICGKEELTETHVHGAGCFIEVQETKETYPAQSFEDEAANVKITAEAPEGAFPEGTTMHVKAVDESAVAEAVNSAAPGPYQRLQAVDITFHDRSGMEIQPLVPIRVTMVDANDEQGEPVVLHLNEVGQATVMDADASLENGASFDASHFSTYVFAVRKLQQTMTASDGRTYEISVTYTDDAGIPDDAELVVKEITEADSSFISVFDKAKDAATSQHAEAVVTNARFFDITIMKDGVEIEPLTPVEVSIVLKAGIESADNTSVVHFTNHSVEVLDADVSTVENEKAQSEGVEVTFTTESFSIYGVVEMRIQKDILASDGNNYRITVTYDYNAGVPANAQLSVTEITPESDPEAYADYLARIENAMGWEDQASYARLFDIKILDGNGEKVELNAPVNVTIELADKVVDANAPETQVMHFADDAEEPDVVQGVDVEGEVVSFAADSFSVYAIVDAPSGPPMPEQGEAVHSLPELVANLSDGMTFYMSVQRSGGTYFTNTLNGTVLKPTTVASEASQWSLEEVDREKGQYLLCTMVGSEKRYVKNSGVNLQLVERDGTVFEISDTGSSSFFFKCATENYWLQYSNGGKGFRFYGDNSTKDNCWIKLTYAAEGPRDPYQLDGKSFGIAYHDERATAAALMAEVKDSKHLVATDMVMRPDVLDDEGVLLVAENSDITLWTFHCDSENRYYISTDLDGERKYLALDGQALTLEDAPENATLFSLTPGADENAGKYLFTAVGSDRYIAPDLNGTSANKGFWGTNKTEATSWLNLVKKTNLSDDNFFTYSAKKVSVSDTELVPDGAEVVIYTRVWNDKTKRYDFYVVDHDGRLIRGYDAGDNIEWVFTDKVTTVWKFTDYPNSQGEPSYYYDLQSTTEYADYIAPQLTNNQVLSDSPIGINLDGRRNGENYTTIIAWDTNKYAFAGLKVEDGRLVACPAAEADDFYFAIMKPHVVEDEPTEVATIDSTQYGIELRMVDFNNAKVDDRDSEQTNYLGRDSNGDGLVRKNLGSDGYPVVATDKGIHQGDSLQGLFGNPGEVNHLFIQSIYNESGYFEYNSTSNFAHLNEDGTFKVYDQLGAIGDQATRPTGQHGQFMPYNDLTKGKFCSFTNATDVLAQPLADTDPRKGEKLYNIGTMKTVDYFFGMEMSASFTQTPSGLDDWGHDIVFEFSGDDDFWFFVDGRLVLDLGGVHSAQSGSVNFRTGQVKRSAGRPDTTLYDAFKASYKEEHPDYSEEQVLKWLNEQFEQKEDGSYVFRDYTKHDMKVFYMERGAGASNLHMRFNLAAVRPGTFVLSKTLSGTDDASNKLISFPYQIWYKMSEEEEEYILLDDPSLVTYTNNGRPVTYRDSYTAAGAVTEYSHVFFLKPGESAEVALPEGAVSYYVKECGVKPSVYDEVKANGEDTKVKDTSDSDRKDFVSSPDSMEGRPTLEFDNHVKPEAVRSMTITKKLYDADGVKVLSYPEDDTLFTFRLYLGNEDTAPEKLPAANLHTYFVKNPDGNYCLWNDQVQAFNEVLIDGSPTGDYGVLGPYLETLTSEQKQAIVFTTSPNGSISNIPAGYTIEVRDLIAGTQFKVEERSGEIPRGYTLRLQDGYTRTDTGDNTGTTPIKGIIQPSETPAVLVSNQKGWGLTVNKVWSDKDFMASHDPIYLAVYVKNDAGGEDLLEGYVRKLEHPDTQVYFFFDSLKNDRPFKDYVIHEVVVDESTGTVQRVIYEGEKVTIGGKPINGSHEGFEYTVSYEVGEQTTKNENVRTDTVTNTRPGIKIIKTDLSGEAPLAEARFTLKDAQGENVAKETYVSDAKGLITIAYLPQGTYTLHETTAPKGYVAIPEDIVITVGEGGAITADGPNGLYELVTNPEDGMLADLFVRNRVSSFVVRKVDASTWEPLSGATFDLYRQVKNYHGDLVKDDEPIPGYEDLATDENGTLEHVTLELGEGTYYLTETAAPANHNLIGEDVVFTINPDGSISMPIAKQQSWLVSETDPRTGDVSYILRVPNGEVKKFSFMKVDVSDTSLVLQGAEFDLYESHDGHHEHDPLYADLVSGADGILAQGEKTEFSLPIGEYQLIETKAPDGYNLRTKPVTIKVTADGVSYDDGTTISSNGTGLSYDENSSTFLLKITNSKGVLLPSTGGPGTTLLMVAGATIVMAASVGLLKRKQYAAHREA